MSITGGIDVGSTMTKIVILKDKKIIDKSIVSSGFDYQKTVDELWNSLLKKNQISLSQIDYVISTGYGRKVVPFADRSITEITANVKGIKHSSNYKKIRTIIDIGGQDTKIIILNEHGNIKNFFLNDKCAAGTGRFLEEMAKKLEMTLEEFSQLSFASHEPIKINSTCTIFAESEVISLVAQGKKKENIIAGLTKSIAYRIGTLAKNAEILPPVFVSGGVSKNKEIIKFLQEILNTEIFVPPEPQFIAALGAGIIAHYREGEK